MKLELLRLSGEYDLKLVRISARASRTDNWKVT